MTNASGTIILNGVTDKELELIFGFKAKHPNTFTFSPNVMQSSTGPNGVTYNNVHFSYQTLHGLNMIAEIANLIGKSEAHARAA